MFFSLSDWDSLKPSLSDDGWDGDMMLGVKRNNDDRKRLQNRKLTPLLPGVGNLPHRAFFPPAPSGVFHERPFLSGQPA